MMRNYRRLALATTAATYFLIFVGGLVRVAGAGLGCPDWPKCFGSWIPPLSVSQLPADINPATFNVTLAWIEWTNRLIGMTVGFLILGVAILALRYYRRSPGVLWPSLAAAVLVAFQGWQGSVVVSSGLQPFVVTIHMVLALVIVSLLIYAVMKSYSTSGSVAGDADVTRRPRRFAAVLWLITIGQIILGSQVRQAVETAAAEFPLWSQSQWLATSGALEDVHFILGILVLALTFFIGQMVHRMAPKCSKLAMVTVRSMMAIVFWQAATGVVLQTAGLPPLVDLFHLWLASLFLGLGIVLYVAISRPSVTMKHQQVRFRRLVVTAGIALAIMAGLAYAVIEQAKPSHETSLAIGAVHPSETIGSRGRNL